MSVPSTQPTLNARLQDPKDERASQRFESRYRVLVLRLSVCRG